MKRYILTGTPGSGKTSVALALEIKGEIVAREAATDIIAYKQSLGDEQPWLSPSFIDHIIMLQRQREQQLSFIRSLRQFYDRSPICTYALAVYLNFPISEELDLEIKRIQQNAIYTKDVFFMENLGFCEPTAARQISFEEALMFEQIHHDVYRQFGFNVIPVAKAPLMERVDYILGES